MNLFNNKLIKNLPNLETMKNRNNRFANFLEVQNIKDVALGFEKEAVQNSNAMIYDVQRAPESAAMFDIIMKRLTANIASPLPAPIFGALDKESDYTEIIPVLVPDGVSYVIDRTTDRKGLKITYTDGVGTDIVEISCVQNAYLNLLRATQGSLIKLEQNKLNISDVTHVSQFSKKVQVTKNTLFGRDTTDSFTPNQFKTDMQNQNDIRVITQNFDVDAETSLVFMIEPVANFEVTLTSYVSKFSTVRAKGY